MSWACTCPQEARNWYRLAAAQGHAGARTALARLDAPGSDDPKQHDARALRRKMDCLAALQAMTADLLDTMHRQASGAIRSIKTD